MKTSTLTRFGVLVAALAIFAGASSAVAAASPVWLTKHGEQPSALSAYTSPEKWAIFEVFTSGNGARAYTLSCQMKIEGGVNWGGHGQIEKVTNSLCGQEYSGVESCAPPTFVEAQNLPWATELVYGTGSEVRNLIKPGSKGGTPGWKITCGEPGFGLTEKCPFGGYSRFSKNGEPGAELLYEPEFARGEMCESTNGVHEGNTIKLNYLEVTPGYTISS